MSSEIDFDPDVFHGELTVNRAQILVRVPRTGDPQDCELHGYVHGPHCEHAHTLPAKFQLQDLGPGPTLLARAVITDPCYWTSDLPQIYDVHVELRQNDQVLAREQRKIGLRGIGGKATASGGQLIREGKAWIPRGVAVSSIDAGSLDSLRDALLVGVTDGPPPLDLLVEASRRGVYLIVQLRADQHDLVTSLKQLARWPAVMMAIVQGGEALDRSLTQVAPNILLAQRVRRGVPADWQPAPWAGALALELESNESVQFAPTVQLPILVQRAVSKQVSVEEARAACDRLQRELALHGQFAGYLV